jgi:L-fuculose-phosphate aldolase
MLSLRRELIDTALAMNRLDLNQGSSGNLSVRYGDGMLITPSALPYDRCRPGDIVRMKMDESVHGPGKPSSEWRFHLDLYASRPEAGAVLHAHPPWCTALACLDREIPSFHYMVAVAGGDSIRCAPYALYGTAELSRNVDRALKDRTACLMSHHGMLCYGDTLENTLALALEVEHLARVYCTVLQLGSPGLLDHEQMTEVLDQFAGYRSSG